MMRTTDFNPPVGDLQPIFDLLRGFSGVDFRRYRSSTILRRLMRRLSRHRLNDVEAYVTLLQSDPPELRGLFQDLLIPATRFFREPESFAALTGEVFPRLIEQRDPELPIRIWVCGCATGEEAYSLAIVLHEFLQRVNAGIRAQIVATDINDAAIAHARAGVYRADIAGDVGPERLRRFFTGTGDHYRVRKAIRDMCAFLRHDLITGPPVARLDLVMCRNVLIYFDATLRQELIAMFQDALEPRGCLVLGQAESVGAPV